ncbi:MAG: hypothetical protein EPO10_17625 [Reyranella sp.]|uniref:hypothetical protein n=1 Tax=Reyranella sp. TaxID=1929291 RepID=UPI0011F8DC2F|nr:hypothetical protein [Reyranella sp.]TAJ89113.1 MAG: hypothetical protein EPO41_19445 [Reyranella sp.]TBR27534.1 MAG: hypothetical protein EPO10_17625 [Reyranella sp.]
MTLPAPSHPFLDGRSPRTTFVDLALLVVVSGAVLIALILWFDNAQGGLTGNGVFKSLELKPWVVDPANAPLYASNYLFYPAYGALCRLLDLLGVFAGDPRRQLTILNAVSASLCTGAAYLLARAVTGDRVIAWLTGAFHLSTSHVMFLAIVNEDIMPSYTVMFAAMSLGAVWFARPSVARVAAVSVLFSIGWLFEWRLMFPTLPAMLAALWFCERRWSLRFAWIALFLGAMVTTAALMALAWHGHPGAVGPFDLIWTGKAVRSVWAGFTWPKVGYLWDGIVAYLLGTGVTTFDGIPGWDIWRFATTFWLIGMAWVAGSVLWPTRGDERTRALVAVFGVTFLAGEVFNLYSQPQDPQMQINVMAWVTPAWALVLLAARRRWPARGLAAMTAVTVALFAYNVWSIAPLRGLDTKWRLGIERLEQLGDPSRTVFLLHDFDWTMVYASLHWGTSEPGVAALGPAPQALPRFKWIGFTGDVLRHPDWSTERHVEALRQQIDRALALGYEVIVVRLWNIPEAQLLTETGMVADAARLGALQRMLRTDFVATPVSVDPVAGSLYRLQRAAGR